MQISRKQLVLFCAFTMLAHCARPVPAQVPTTKPSPFENTGTSDYTGTATSIAAGGPNSLGQGGIEIGNATYYFSPPPSASNIGTTRYPTGFVLTPSGTVNLGTFSGAVVTGGTGTGTGVGPDIAKSINTNGTLIAGISNSDTSVSSTVPTGLEAVWSGTGSAIAVLPESYTDSFGDSPKNGSGLINNFGTVVGSGLIYSSSGAILGSGTPGAFVWVNTGTVAAPVYNSYSELLAPSNSTGSISTGARSESALGISDSGLAVGAGSTYNSSGTFTGSIAVTWDTTSTPAAAVSTSTPQTTIAPVLLVNPSLPTDGRFGGVGPYTYMSANGTGTTVPAQASQAGYVNSSNVIAGSVTVYDSGTLTNSGRGTYNTIGTEPTVWNGAGSTGAFLPLLSTSYQAGNVTGINVGGDILGNQTGAGGLATGVLWKAGSSYAPTLLAVPTGTNPVTNAAYSSSSHTYTLGLNDYGYSVGLFGTSAQATNGSAILWNPSGVPLDLNRLVTLVAVSNGTTAGWVSLVAADAVNNQGYISGLGIYYDPNATYYSSGSLGSTPGEYYLPFEIYDPADATPEPASMSLLIVPGLMLMRRRRRSDRAPK